MTASKESFFAAWSTEDGTFALALDNRGVPLAAPFEVGLADDGLAWKTSNVKALWPVPPGSSLSAVALSIVPLENAAALLALVPGDPGAAYLCPLAQTGSGSCLRLGEAGPNATTIDATSIANSELIAAWHVGKDSGSEIALARVALKKDGFVLVAASPLERAGATLSPSLASGKDGVLLAFAELSGGSPPSVVVNAAGLDASLSIGTVYTVGRGRYLNPTVDVVATKDGFGLVYRDDLDDDDIPEYYHVALTPNGSPAGAPVRISKADGFTGPRLARQDDLFVAAAIRSFQRNLLIGMNRFDERGHKLGGELQIYADKSDFVRVDIASGDGFTLLVYGEDRDESARVLSSRIRCRP